MTSQNWVSVTIWEDTPLKAMARIKTIDNAAATQNNISSISYRVVCDGVEIVASTALTVSAVIFNTLQTGDASWKADAVGYNFRYVFPAATFPTGDKTYYVPITFTDTAGLVSVLGLKVTTRETYVDTPAP